MNFARAVLLLCVALCGRLAAAEPVAVLLVAADEAALRPVLAKLNEAQSNRHAAWTT